jgi:hypothetical protein
MKHDSKLHIRSILMTVSLSGVLILAGCGGGGGSAAAPAAAPVISGVAAAGAPITPAMNGVVTIQDSASPAHTATTPTDANGNYSFTSEQLSGWVFPFMMEVDYKVAGMDYNLHSVATASDLTSGSATINITPLTDLVIANLAGTIASNVFKNQATYASKLTPSALAAGASALAAQLQPILATQGVSASVDLFRTSFSADGTGLDAVLDALKVVQDPTTNTATITSRLDGSSITDTLGSSNTATLSAPAATVPITDLQAITNYFASFSTEMTKAPAPTDTTLLAFFDQTNFEQDGKSLAAFLQQVTTNPTILGGTLSFGNIVLDTVPSWVTTVPSTASASYKVHFTVLINGMTNGRDEFIVYKDSSGNWIALGNQKVAKVTVEALETNGPVYNNSSTPTRVSCTGLWPQVNDKGGIGINFAVVTGPGLPSAGLLLYQDVNGTNASDFTLAAGDPTTYAGTATVPATTNTSTCGFSNLYPLDDTTIGNIAASSMKYTIKLYKDGSGTPSYTNPGNTLVATYGPTLVAAPLTNALLASASGPGLFATNESASPAILSLATGTTVTNTTVSWTAPTAPDLYATSVGIWVGNNLASPTTANTYDWVNQDLAGDATSASLAVPLVSGANYAGVTIDYLDNQFREYWTSF